ncbi:MAG TPA: NHLP bacteriocin export ABC transporter permease/ATPase subunit [Acidobacteriaceae bacterium]|jgi:NHLM bacteriocin system ABC transporter ATP-binding protein|nr:NHLP bacteriocin export ABC transporter permease/ATPase subunit [Acidobacteriaceae bacterium]
MELTEQNNKTASTPQLATSLTTPGAVWVVRAGSVHLFLARVNAEGETLARHPFCRVDAEEVLFSLHGAAPAGWSVVAQATAETQVERLAQHENLSEHMPRWLAKLRHAAGLDEDVTGIAAERLQETQQKILVAAIELQRQKDEAERARIAKRHAEDQRHIDESFRRLASTLVSERKRFDFNPDVDDQLFAACEALGRDAGIHFTPPVEMLRHLPMRDPLAAIARASSVRYRKVALSARIWSVAEQPFLARRDADGAPLAFLPNARRGYNVFDPATRTATRVTEEIVQSLEPFGTIFYRPFPARRLGVRDVLTFGLRGSARDLWVLALMGSLAGLLGTVAPLLTSNIFDYMIPMAEHAKLLLACMFLVTAAIAAIFFRLVQSFAVLRMEGRMESSLQAAIWDRILNLPVPFFRQYSAGDLATRGMAISEMRRVLSSATLSSIFTAAFSIFSYALLFYFSVQLALLATALTALALLLTAGCGFLYVRYQREIFNIQGTIAGTLLAGVQGIAKFRIAGAEDRAFVNWATAFAKQKIATARTARLNLVLRVFHAVFPLFGAICIFYVMEQQKMMALSTGNFLAFILAYGQFTGAVMACATSVLPVLNVVPLYDRARPILEAVPETAHQKAASPELTGRVELNQVAFRYAPENALILNGITCEIHPGEFVAFVGTSGAGKSTLLRLLLGFERPETGSIYYDGQELQNLDIQSVRQQMGVVLQNATLFSGDIYSNIVGSSPYSMDEAWEAAKLAGCDAEIRALPMGMHTALGEGGMGLSGGQRQRIMIARALVGRPKIVIFDEATSALDNHAQALVSRSLEQLDVTRIVIAHRLSTIVNADKIFVMDGGRIVQTGTYDELMQQRGLFASLAARQVI